jgi:hypothetical protein
MTATTVPGLDQAPLQDTIGDKLPTVPHDELRDRLNRTVTS